MGCDEAPSSTSASYVVSWGYLCLLPPSFIEFRRTWNGSNKKAGMGTNAGSQSENSKGPVTLLLTMRTMYPTTHPFILPWCKPWATKVFIHKKKQGKIPNASMYQAYLGNTNKNCGVFSPLTNPDDTATSSWNLPRFFRTIYTRSFPGIYSTLQVPSLAGNHPGKFPNDKWTCRKMLLMATKNNAQITSLVWDGVKNLQIQKINTIKVLNSLTWMLSLRPWIQGETKTQVLFSRIFGTYHLKTRDISPWSSWWSGRFFFFFPYLWKGGTIERASFWNWVVQPQTAGTWCYTFFTDGENFQVQMISIRLWWLERTMFRGSSPRKFHDSLRWPPIWSWTLATWRGPKLIKES